MLRVLVIGVLLSAFLHDANAENNARISKEIKLQHPHSYTVAIDPHVLTIAINASHLFVNSTDVNFKPCNIALEGYTIQKRIEATVISRKIVVWGVRGKHETAIGDRIEHTVLIVDPWQCTFKAASTFEEERPPHWWTPYYRAQVVQVAKEDAFDVFYPSLKTCAPCRYSLDGKRIDLQHQLEVNHIESRERQYTPFFRIQRYSAYGIRGVNSHGDLQYDWGYVFAYNFGNGSAVIKILDENFRAVRQRFMDHGVDGVAVNPYGPSNVYVCHKTPPFSHIRTANNSVICESLDERDANLKQSYSIRLPMLEGYAPDALSMNANGVGELYVSVVQSTLQGRSGSKFVLYWITSTGRLTDSATFHQLPDDVRGQWNIRSFFSDFGYCIENTAERFQRLAKYEFVKCALLHATYRPVLE